MAIKFETFGPFPIERADHLVTADELRAFCELLDSKKDGLSKAIGVYILGLDNGREIDPWYVGKTDKGFARRFDQHYKGKGKNLFLKVAGKIPAGNLQVFLLARMTASGKFMKGKRAKGLAGKVKIRRSTRPVRSIDRLEFRLIGTCLSKNPDLLNESLRSFHKGFYVPGYMDESEPSNTSAARSLKRMLRVKK